MAQPIVSWFEETYDSGTATYSYSQATSYQIGTVDAGGSPSPDRTFLIWNNKGNVTSVSKMEEVTITTKALDGTNGNPDGNGNIIEPVAEDWVECMNPDLGETAFTPIGGNTTKAIQAGGTTIKAVDDGAGNPLRVDTLPAWLASTAYATGDKVIPTTGYAGGVYYECTTAGTSGSSEPTWSTTIGGTVTDGSAVWTVMQGDYTNGTQEILGVSNDGVVNSDATSNAIGNFCRSTLHAVVPPDANAGQTDFKIRVAYRYV